MAPTTRQAIVVSVIACPSIALLCAVSRFAAGEQVSAKPGLIAAVDPAHLLARWGVTPERPHVSDHGVVYYLRGGRAGPWMEMTLAVHRSIAEAEAAYADFPGMSMTEQRLERDSPGDQLRYWRSTDMNDLGALVNLRRDNVIVWVHVRGSVAEMIAVAREIDRALLTEPGTAPRAEAVPVSAVDVQMPSLIVAGKTARLRVTVTGGLPVTLFGDVAPAGKEGDRVCCLGNYAAGFFTETMAHLSVPRPGKYKATLRFATEGNVVFTRTCDLNVIAAEDLPAEYPREWQAPGSALNFMRSSGLKWGSGPSQQREWLQYDRGTMSTEASESWRDRALAELRQIVRGRWVPVFDVVHACTKSTLPQDMVYYSVFRTAEYGVVYMGVLGKHLFVYIEQPDPLPAGHELLTAQDVLTETVLSTVENDADARYPRGPLMTRNLRRYRALRPEGPYEPVNILLLEIGSMTPLDLHNPGYR